MEFEHVTFDLPHGTFHALQGGDPDARPTLVLHGFPDHPPTAGPFDFASLTSDVLALIDRWSPGRAVELVGQDWGAMITYDARVTAPERIERAVTLAIPPHVSEPASPRSATPQLVHGLLQLPGSGRIGRGGTDRSEAGAIEHTMAERRRRHRAGAER
ncbi:hypothetical protein PV379_32355 [Streptomyces caniscabiei]|uniref:hypothetical protein n=1 Tax=Streptomyces caniscabiei TaxID=2746961 RepID=UPI0029AEDA62|nr:hypothetical protein [Streptomyces caniscabiei]MDX2606723.1 hypothetical protein [Streptomyces caniscabiei]MDX2733810.1 hypothetical protein [Streptomyces caniscabiei]MDX2781959.1 hypothetical protein [Streptomyces caniscabiei]